MQILIDADACPRDCLDIVDRQCGAWSGAVMTVSSHHHNLERPNHIITADGPDAVDWEIASRATAGDLVITQDSGLAALALAKNADALNPMGFFYSEESITAVLEERALKARYRRSGGRTKGPRRRTVQDNRRFARALDSWLGHPNRRQSIQADER